MKNDAPDQKVDSFVKALVMEQGLDKTKTIKVLQRVQEEFGYLPKKSISSVARYLRIPTITVLGVATFYEQFRFNKPGKYTIKVCQGTACHVKGGEKLLKEVERQLSIKPGETTEDNVFSSERVACLGCCALAPVVVINDKLYSKMNTSRLARLIKKFSAQAKKESMMSK
ncbi:MAG: NADH-quinone oxidoreductase subunit NuoE [Candidatus Ranarchaeia archaeon]